MAAGHAATGHAAAGHAAAGHAAAEHAAAGHAAAGNVAAGHAAARQRPIVASARPCADMAEAVVRKVVAGGGEGGEEGRDGRQPLDAGGKLSYATAATRQGAVW